MSKEATAASRGRPVQKPATDDLPARIRALREAMGMNASAFARHLGVTGMTVSNWERGKRFPAEHLNELNALFRKHRMPEVACNPRASDYRCVVAPDEIWMLRKVMDGGLSAERFGKILGVSKSCVHGWEQTGIIGPRHRAKLLGLLDIWDEEIDRCRAREVPAEADPDDVESVIFKADNRQKWRKAPTDLDQLPARIASNLSDKRRDSHRRTKVKLVPRTIEDVKAKIEARCSHPDYSKQNMRTAEKSEKYRRNHLCGILSKMIVGPGVDKARTIRDLAKPTFEEFQGSRRGI